MSCAHCDLLALFRRGAEALTKEYFTHPRFFKRQRIWFALHDYCILAYTYERLTYPVHR